MIYSKETWAKYHTKGFSQNGYTYIGEIVNSNNVSIPHGTGLLYNEKQKDYIMVENINNGVCNGLFFETQGKQFEKDSHLIAGEIKNDKRIGPMLMINKYTGISYFDNDDPTKPTIHIGKKGYSISKYDTINKKYYTIRFQHGNLLLEESDKDFKNNIIVNKIECGWDYEFLYHVVDYHRYVPYHGNVGPAFARVYNDEEQFWGMVECVGSGLDYKRIKDKIILDVNANGIGILPFLNSNLYFGQVKKLVGGNVVAHGFGCFRNNDRSSIYIGEYGFDKKDGIGMLTEGGITYLANFTNNYIDGGCFKITKDSIIIANYQNGKQVNYLYKINFDTMSVVKYRPNDKNVEVITFYDSERKNPNGINVEVNNYEKISPRYRYALERLNLDYKVLDSEEIIVTGKVIKDLKHETKDDKGNYQTFDGVPLISDPKIIYIPSFVSRVSDNAFCNYSKLEKVTIYDGVKELGEGAFKDCKNIKEVQLPNTIEVIKAHTFQSSKLFKIEIPESVTLIKNYAFSECPNLREVIIKNKNCIVEEFAFAKQPENKVVKNKKVKKEKEEKNKTNLLMLLSTIPLSVLGILVLPFKLLAVFIKKLFQAKGALILATLIISILYIVFGITGVVKYFTWEIRGISPSDNMFFGYGFELASIGINLFGMLEGSGLLGILIFIGAILCLILGGIIDIIVYILMFIVLTLLPMLVQIIVQLLIVFGIPILIPISSIIMAIKTKNKLMPIITFLISTACAVIYFIYLITML